jgi:DNA recombination protein RmuC
MMQSLDVAALVAGIAAIGAAVLFVILARRGLSAAASLADDRLRGLESDIAALREEKAGLDRRLAVEEERSSRIPGLERGLAEKTAQMESLVQAKAAVETQLAASAEGLVRVEAALQDVSAKFKSAEQFREDLRTRLAALQETLDQERKQSGEKVALLVDAKKRMTQEFKLLAEDVMRLHGENFSKQNKEQIETVLAPLR